MMYSIKMASLVTSIVALSACGGSGGTAIMEPAPISLAVESGSVKAIGLNSDKSVVSLNNLSWDHTTQTLVSGGQTLSLLSSEINSDNTYVRRVSAGTAGETLVFSATNVDELPDTVATYAGSATVVISDGSANARAFTLTGNSTLTADLSRNDLDLVLSGLSGNITSGVSGPQPFSTSGTIEINNMTIANGSIGASSNTAASINGITGVSIVGDPSISAGGGIAGPTGQEIAGMAIVTDVDTELQTIFAGN